jgi:NADH-quinone oxidoreductase subunit C
VGKSRLVLRLIVPHNAPKAPSISAIFPGADWHELECFDFYGIDFTGHPNLHFLLLP